MFSRSWRALVVTWWWSFFVSLWPLVMKAGNEVGGGDTGGTGEGHGGDARVKQWMLDIMSDMEIELGLGGVLTKLALGAHSWKSAWEFHNLLVWVVGSGPLSVRVSVNNWVEMLSGILSYWPVHSSWMCFRWMGIRQLSMRTLLGFSSTHTPPLLVHSSQRHCLKMGGQAGISSYTRGFYKGSELAITLDKMDIMATYIWMGHCC